MGLKMISLALRHLGSIQALWLPSTDRLSVPLQGERLTTTEADFITAIRELMGEKADNPDCAVDTQFCSTLAALVETCQENTPAPVPFFKVFGEQSPGSRQFN